MQFLLGILIFSFLINSILIIPFINFLYKLKFTRRQQETRDPFGKRTLVFDLLNKTKAGTPIGGGILLIFMQIILSAVVFVIFRFFDVKITHLYHLKKELFIILFTMLSFGLIGLYDDLLKLFQIKKRHFFGLKFKSKLLIQLGVALFIGLWLHYQLGINFIYLGPLGILNLGWLYVIFAAFFIVFFANAYNITDGLDGLSGGLLLFNLLAFWFISATILDNVLSVFLAIWIGGLISFLYFNIYPARVWLGDIGALSFGATLALIGLLLGKILPVVFISSLFIIEALSSLIQLSSKRYLKHKIFPVAPLHLWLRSLGWEESKIVTRAWLAQLIISITGLWLSFFL